MLLVTLAKPARPKEQHQLHVSRKQHEACRWAVAPLALAPPTPPATSCGAWRVSPVRSPGSGIYSTARERGAVHDSPGEVELRRPHASPPQLRLLG